MAVPHRTPDEDPLGEKLEKKGEKKRGCGRSLLSATRSWVKWGNRPQTEAELEAVRRSVARGYPFGAPAWQERTAHRFGMEFTLRPRGRPRKAEATPEPPEN